MSIVVQKFGGTSVADAARIRRAAQKAVDTKRSGQQVVMVVSARGKKTDELVGLAAEITARPRPREMDMLLSTGEQESVALMAMAVHELGEEAISLTGAQIGVRTDGSHTKARIISISTQRIKNALDAGQIVIAGHTAAVERVCVAAKTAGARRALPLPVSVPSHCALMRDAADSLSGVLAGVDMQPAQVPVIQNADVTAHESADDIRDALARQLWQPVRWTETISSLLDSGVDKFVECGPGKVLAGLNRRITKGSKVFALTGQETINQAMAPEENNE